MTLPPTWSWTAPRSAAPAPATAPSPRCWTSCRGRRRRPGAGLQRARPVRGRQRPAAAYVECAVGERVLWGVGIDANTITASLKAVISAVNRAIRDAQRLTLRRRSRRRCSAAGGAAASGERNANGAKRGPTLCSASLPRRGRRAAHPEAGRGRPHHHPADPRARPGPGGGQGRPAHQLASSAPGSSRSCMSTCSCSPAGSLDIVTQAETHRRRTASGIAADYGRYTAGTAMPETAERLTDDERRAGAAAVPAAGRRRCARSPTGEHDAGAGARRVPAAGARRRRLGAELRRLRPLRRARTAPRLRRRRAAASVCPDCRPPGSAGPGAETRRAARCAARPGTGTVADASRVRAPPGGAAGWWRPTCSGTWSAACDPCSLWSVR